MAEQVAFEPVIGLEVHAELGTRSKMFCACPVVDSTQAQPNTAVCPVCSGMPGVLPVLNARAVEFGVRVALALGCQVYPISIFARKNYFYPDLPKGYQISQYEQPLARHGQLNILTASGEKQVRVRRVHLEEDTGKLTHVTRAEGSYSLVDLNRAGVPLLEIVSEPDLSSADEVRRYAQGLRSLMRYLGVNSGDMQKGILRIEPNVSVRLAGSTGFGTRVEIKNLNSFRALERSVAYEIQRQSEALRRGEVVLQETRGWDDTLGETFTQRVKEGEDDYRYFPEPDLPPLALDAGWVEGIRSSLPELPYARFQRFTRQYGLSRYDAEVLTAERAVADYFEQVLAAAPGLSPKAVANWLSGELFGLMNQAGVEIGAIRIAPEHLAGLVQMVQAGEINSGTAKTVLAEMFASGEDPRAIIERRGIRQVSDLEQIAGWVAQVLAENPEQVHSYLAGKESLFRWLFGQVSRLAKGQGNPQLIQQELERQLSEMKSRR